MAANVCSRKSRRIYLAGSWKNADNILALRDLLKAEGHEVDCFASTDTGRTSFNWSELIEALGCQERVEAEVKLAGMDAIDLLSFDRVIEAFREDKKFLDWCDTCILILPSGKSAHLEAGYAKGQGKTLIIFGEFLKGERDVMYGFADGLYRDVELSSMIDRLNHGIPCPDCSGCGMVMNPDCGAIDHTLQMPSCDECEASEGCPGEEIPCSACDSTGRLP